MDAKEKEKLVRLQEMILWMNEDSKKYQYGAFTKQEGMFE